AQGPTMTRHPVRIPLFWRVTIALLAIVILTGAGTIYWSRALASNYGCLQSDHELIDVLSGQTIPTEFFRHYSTTGYQTRVSADAPKRIIVNAPAYMWAVSGKRTAHIEYDYAPRPARITPWVIIDSPEEHIQLELPARLSSFSYAEGYFADLFVWSGTAESYSLPAQQLTWSPDGRYALDQYYDKSAFDEKGQTHFWHFNVFGIDGSSSLDVATLKQNQGTLSVSRVVWSADSRFLIFPEGAEAAKTFAYDVTTK